MHTELIDVTINGATVSVAFDTVGNIQSDAVNAYNNALSIIENNVGPDAQMQDIDWNTLSTIAEQLGHARSAVEVLMAVRPPGEVGEA